jgi:hypothetical protein
VFRAEDSDELRVTKRARAGPVALPIGQAHARDESGKTVV